ncbi:hypothetical protein [Tsukamurella sp. 1534]|uniref:hypothetical protein n=1 Tax=Tsukamurella sp. 1534 TaxID=1151061 RepID=UPI0002D7195C|nr:hypothetical protein [Tsukamurella sp. 1534]
MTSGRGVAAPTAWRLLRRSRSQVILIAVLALALQIAITLPLTLWDEQRTTTRTTVSATVPDGDLIVTADAPIPATAAAGATTGGCTVGEVQGEVLVEPGTPGATSIPGRHRAARGDCAERPLPPDTSRLTRGDGPGSFDVMGTDRQRHRVIARPALSSTTTSLAVDDPALSRSLLGSDDQYAVIAVAGKDSAARAGMIQAPGTRITPRDDYVGAIATTQVAATGFVKTIAELFAVIAAACLLAALAFAATLLAINHRPQMRILWRIGVPRRTRATILGVEILALTALSALATVAVFVVIAAAVPSGWTALGTFTVQRLRATPPALLGSTALVAVVLTGAFVAGSGTDRRGDHGPPRRRWLLQGVGLVAGVALLVAGGRLVLSPIDGAVTWIVVGHCLLVVGTYALCSPLLTLVSRLRSVGTFRGVLLPWFGFGGIARARAQAGVVVAFLVFVSGLVAVVSVFASSTSASIARQIDANVGAQFVAEPQAGFTIDDRDVAALRAVPGPGAVVAVSPLPTTAAGTPLNGIAIDGSLRAGALLVDLREGTEEIAPQTALLSETTAARTGVRTDGTVEIGDREYRVGGVYRDAPTLGDFVIAARPDAAYAYVLVTAPGQAAVKDALTRAAPTAVVRSIGDYQVQQARESRQILDALQQLSVLSGIGLLLALTVVLGVLNAGRRDEWRALTRIGLRRSRITAMVAIEAAAIASISVLAGLAAGLLTGLGVARYLASSGLSDIVADPVLLGSAFVGLTAVGVAVYVLTSLGVLRRISF